MVGEISQHRRGAAGDAALHVDGAAAIEIAVLHLARERAKTPGGLIAWRHHVGMTREGDMRSGGADTGVEIVDVSGAGLAEGDAVRLETGAFKDIFENAER